MAIRNPRLAEVLDYLTAQRARLLDAVDRVPAGRREERPAAGRWSAAEVLDHLARVEVALAGRIEALAREGRAAGVPDEASTASVLGCMDGFPFLDRSKPLTARGPNVPAERVTMAEARRALTASRRTLETALEVADGLALERVKAPHPVGMELDGYQWAMFVGQHEARHAQQVIEIADHFARG